MKSEAGLKNKIKFPVITLILLIFILCLVHAVVNVHNADFGPLNGTFQDFNPIRRFLSGQIPYREFSDYLGLGHLYIGTAFTVLFGSSFTASKTAFVFLAVLSLAFFSVTLGMVIFKSHLRGLAITGILLSLMIIQPMLPGFSFLSSEIREAFLYTLKNGNSARMVRGFILPLFCLLIIALIKYQSRKKQKTKMLLFLFSFCSGFVLPWSNDYGISLFFCLWIMITIIVFSRTRSFLRTLLCSLAHLFLSLLGAAVFVEIFTLGHLPQWLHTTFGIGGFQRWYPNTEKHFYVFSIDLTPASTLQLILCLIYIYKLFRERGSNEVILRCGIPALANLTGFCALNEYYMISGDSAREVPLIILTLTLIFEVLRFLFSFYESQQTKIDRCLLTVSAVFIFSCVIPALYSEFIYQKITKKEGTYFSQMGGNVTDLGDSLTKGMKFISDDKIFSTYASAMELVTGQFHPSGTDYIIHVMGDENRADYLDCFRNDDFRYAVTIQETYSPWEYYIQRSNWFFYRELYRSWHPVFSNAYQLYWERNEAGLDHVIDDHEHDITVEIEQIEPTEAKIMVRTDTGINGIADVLIDYDVNKNNSFFSKLMFQRMLYVSGDKNSFSDLPFYGTNYLRESSSEFIPVTIVNGYGEILLNSVPKENTNLVINSVSCEEIFTAPLDYVEVLGVGYSGEIPFLRIPKIRRTQTALPNAKTIVLGDYEIPVRGLKEDSDGIMLMVDLADISFNDLDLFIGGRRIAELRE